MKGKKIVTALAWIVLVAIIAAVIAVLYRYTNGFNEDFKTFYIERDGKKILTAKSAASFEPGSEVRFDVGYTFDVSKSEARDYNVEILPNPEADFDFELDELSYSWRLVDGLEECFSLDKRATYFTLTVPLGGIEEILHKTFRTSVDIGGSFPQGIDPETPFYLLRVSSYNKAVTYEIAFSVADSEEGYTVTFNSQPGGNGWITKIVCPSRAKKGEMVTFSWEWSAESPYPNLKSVVVTTERGASVEVSSEGGWHFTMPDENVTILVTYAFR